MNILLSNSSNIFAGGEDYVLTLAGQLQQRHQRVCVSGQPGNLLLRKCETIGIDTIPIDYTGMSRVFSVAAQLRSELRKRDIQIIHSNANYDRTCAAIAAARTPTAHIATVHSAHSIQHNITHWMRNRYGIAHFIAVAEAVRTVLMEEDGIAEEKISVVPNGVPENAGKDGLRAELRYSLGISEKTVVIGNIARLVLFKGQRYLISAVSSLVRQGLDVQLLIAGNGELQNDLEQQTSALDLTGVVRFLGFREDARDLYHAFDLYCQPSIELGEEAFPIAVLDAMATKLPIVATRVGGIPAMVHDNTSGLLVTPGDADALAEALAPLCHDPLRRKSFGQASYDLFRQKYNAGAMADAVEAIYARVQ